MEAFHWNANTATRSAIMSAMASATGIFGNSTDAVAAGGTPAVCGESDVGTSPPF
ncbi:hypothetical protein CORMATOL_00577 [Corynebacterium matruchotii ATCC 33806]|uniref:Uncharacterized protein n=1 Tax=Corynebacterium matruchotii ATCC 33806 TaxID=566549 RepID=C0E0S6_9CORY|nr:hypothetical protein CORMATOL_00577 [Corynebacterium matruchotii ATCC 33806]